MALYLFLLSGSDSRGLSYYSEASIGRYLRLETVALSAAPAQLVASRQPLYQILSLPDSSVAPASQLLCDAASVADILRRILGAGGGQ